MADLSYKQKGIARAATDGGAGAFSYVDLSIYGHRTQRSQVVVPTHATHRYGGVGDPPTPPAGPSFTRTIAALPGAGGGARVLGKMTYARGGRASGYSPKGAVIIRLFKVG